MMLWILNILARWGVPASLRKAVAVVGGLIALAAILGGLWLWLDGREKADDERNQEIGGTIERERQQTETIKQVEHANDIRNEVRRPGNRALYDQCVRGAGEGTAANCEQFLPQRPAD